MPDPTKVTAAELLSGQVRSRQGGDPDDWSVPGTTNYSEELINIMVQSGAATSTSGTVNVTFDTPFAQIPLIQLTPISSNLVAPVLVSVTKTGFSFRVGLLTGILTSGVILNWEAKGRRPMS